MHLGKGKDRIVTLILVRERIKIFLGGTENSKREKIMRKMLRTIALSLILVVLDFRIQQENNWKLHRSQLNVSDTSVRKICIAVIV